MFAFFPKGRQSRIWGRLSSALALEAVQLIALFSQGVKRWRVEKKALTFVADDLQQIAIRIEKIKAVMISPVNGSLSGDAASGELFLGITKIHQAHPESVVPFAQGVIDPIRYPWG
jgi:hypothetical protein